MGITPNGYETTPKGDILAEVQDAFKSALGEDLSLEASTPQGQLISMITDLLSQIDSNRQQDFYARDLYHAQGLQLDIIGRLLGIPRKAATPTQILVNLQGVINFTIPAGTLANIITDSSKVFEFTSAVSITQETQQVTLSATEGSVYSDLIPGQQLQTQSYIPQIYNMSIVSIVYGTPAESDYSYRVRLIEGQSANVDEVKHLTLALENIPNVLSAYVEPNNTLETSASGIPPHCVEIVVLGGEEQAIGEAIMGYIFATPTYQDPTLGEEIDVVDYNGNQQKFYITRPQAKEVDVFVYYKNKPQQTLTADDKEVLTQRIQEIINSTYMNDTLYKSDICAAITKDFTQTYFIDEIQLEIGSSDIGASYTATSREYLQAGVISFEEVE